MKEEMNQYVRMVSFLGKTLGTAFEAILFDVTTFEYSIVASMNIKDSTSEKARDFVKEAMNSEKAIAEGYYVNRPISLNESRLIKMSVFFVYDDTKKIIGALCLCMRCDAFFNMMNLMSGLLDFNTNDFDDNSNDKSYLNPKEISLDTISEYIRGFGVEPGRTTYNENIEIICDLYDMGVFNLKGAVARTAEELQISSKTIYRYISKIKKARE